MNHEGTKKIKGIIPAGKIKGRPRLVVVREYQGTQSMRMAFRQVIEDRACDQFEQWMEKKPNTRR